MSEYQIYTVPLLVSLSSCTFRPHSFQIHTLTEQCYSRPSFKSPATALQLSLLFMINLLYASQWPGLRHAIHSTPRRPLFSYHQLCLQTLVNILHLLGKHNNEQDWQRYQSSLINSKSINIDILNFAFSPISEQLQHIIGAQQKMI